MSAGGSSSRTCICNCCASKGALLSSPGVWSYMCWRGGLFGSEAFARVRSTYSTSMSFLASSLCFGSFLFRVADIGVRFAGPSFAAAFLLVAFVASSCRWGIAIWLKGYELTVDIALRFYATLCLGGYNYEKALLDHPRSKTNSTITAAKQSRWGGLTLLQIILLFKNKINLENSLQLLQNNLRTFEVRVMLIRAYLQGMLDSCMVFMADS